MRNTSTEKNTNISFINTVKWHSLEMALSHIWLMKNICFFMHIYFRIATSKLNKLSNCLAYSTNLVSNGLAYVICWAFFFYQLATWQTLLMVCLVSSSLLYHRQWNSFIFLFFHFFKLKHQTFTCKWSLHAAKKLKSIHTYSHQAAQFSANWNSHAKVTKIGMRISSAYSPDYLCTKSCVRWLNYNNQVILVFSLS